MHSDETRQHVVVLTHSPSPYQVELFDAVAARGAIDLKVIYLHAHDPQRNWRTEARGHRHVMLTDPGVDREQELRDVDTAELLVVNYYKHEFAGSAMRRRAAAKAAMCFWGERPQRSALPAAATLLRRWRLRFLLQDRTAIWGIGRLAIEAYRREFGDGCDYANLPYFSNLERFKEVTPRPADEECIFLYSGVLNHRKGVDVLASAFARLARSQPAARLRIMGAGPMESLMRQLLGGCIEQVEFIGFRDWGQLPGQYARADFLCVPSRHDGWGLVVPEGLAAGLPIISTPDTGAAVEFLTPGKNGWLVPSGHEEDLLRAMTEAASLRAEERFAMVASARASVAGHSLAEGARRFVEAAKAAIAGCKHPARHTNSLTNTS